MDELGRGIEAQGRAAVRALIDASNAKLLLKIGCKAHLVSLALNAVLLVMILNFSKEFQPFWKVFVGSSCIALLAGVTIAAAYVWRLFSDIHKEGI